MKIPTGGGKKEHLELGTEQYNQERQKLTSEVSSSPELFGVEIHNCSPLQQRHEGRETQGKRAAIFDRGLPLSLLHPLPTATSRGTGDEGIQEHAAGPSFSSLFSWLRPHHGGFGLGPRTLGSQQRGRKSRTDNGYQRNLSISDL